MVSFRAAPADAFVALAENAALAGTLLPAEMAIALDFTVLVHFSSLMDNLFSGLMQNPSFR